MCPRWGSSGYSSQGSAQEKVPVSPQSLRGGLLLFPPLALSLWALTPSEAAVKSSGFL